MSEVNKRDADPRYEWHEITRLGDKHSRWVRGRCLHVHTVPVESSDEIVAYLCLVCDQQLHEDWQP